MATLVRERESRRREGASSPRLWSGQKGGWEPSVSTSSSRAGTRVAEVYKQEFIGFWVESNLTSGE